MASSRRGPRSTEERLQRLLVMLPWLAERQQVATSEMARRFGLSVTELVADLELAAMCGMPPYLDELIDVIVDDDEVSIGVPRLFTRPLRLTAPEAFALVAAARAAESTPGADPIGALATAVDKLSRIVVVEGIDVDLDAPDFADRAAETVRDGVVVQMTYVAESTGETSQRLVEPRQVFTEHGAWYLWAFDRTRDEPRVFRLDRIVDFEPTADWFDPRGHGPRPAWFTDVEVEEVRVRVDESMAWLFDTIVDATVTSLGDGRVEATVKVASENWLASLLVQLGPSVEVVSPPRWQDLAARTAQDILARYDEAD